MSDDPIDQLALVLDRSADLVAGVTVDQWARPTPCVEWTVAQLVDHLTRGHRAFAAALRHEAPAAESAVPPQQATDRVLDYRAAADGMLAAFRAPGALDGLVSVPVGTVPGPIAVRLRIVEVLAHGWDLARATDQEPALPDAIVEEQIEFTRGALAIVPEGRSPFEPPQPVSPDAPPLDRLAALLGRPVTASAARP